jgi:hypothetical protein
MKSFAWGVLVVVIACSSKSPESVDAPGLSGSAACMDEATAVCSVRASCSNNFNIEKNFPDEPTCVSRTAATCVADLGATGTGQTPGKIEACAAEYPTETCTAYFEGDPVASCVPPMGTGAMGSACGASAQCASTYCAITQDQICGTCQPLPIAGAACQVDADCGRDLACATPGSASTGTCAAYVGSGGTCLTGAQPCAPGLACVGDAPATSTTGTCQASGATVGAACDGTRKTLPSCSAELGLVCIPTAKGSAVGTCMAIDLVGPGSACGDVGAMPITGFADCIAGGACIKGSAAATTGTCMAPATDGAACNSDATIGPPCLAPAKCVPTTAGGTAGTCTLPNATTCG